MASSDRQAHVAIAGQSNGSNHALSDIYAKRWEEESELPIPSPEKRKGQGLSKEMIKSHGLSFIHFPKTGSTSVEHAGL